MVSKHDFDDDSINTEEDEYLWVLHELTALGLPTDGWWAIRFTDLDGSVTKEKVEQWCMTQTGTYLVGEETAKNHHFHLAIPYEKNPKNADFTQRIYDYFLPPKIGNSFYSVTPVTEVGKYLCYICKDGDVFSSEDIAPLVPALKGFSFSKPLGYKKEVELLNAEFQAGQVSPKEFWLMLGKTRAFYDLRLNLNQLDELTYAQMVKKDPILLALEVDQRKLFS